MQEVEIMKRYELENHIVGEALTITAVMAVVAVALAAVIVYRIFVSSDVDITIPGGWQFTWS